MFQTLCVFVLGLMLCLTGTPSDLAAKSKPGEESPPLSLQRVNEVWKGNLSDIIQGRRFIRVLVSYNRTNFFIDKGQPRGLEYELLHRYEAHLNRQSQKGITKVKLFYRVLPFDRLQPALIEGRGDIAAAGLTIIPSRQKIVAFTRPYIKNIHAGVKYLAHLRDTYFNDPAIAPDDRVDFTFAAYNAGPSKINSLRRRATLEGLDPNRWNRNVEYVARKVLGKETDAYVANVHMYYLAYKTSLGIIDQREKQLQ